MGYSWRTFKLPRFYGLDLKTNLVDVDDGYSLDSENVFQGPDGILQKRVGDEVMFASDSTSTTEIDEIGSGVVGGTQYYFKFSGGSFYYSTTRTGALTTITPSPAISTTDMVWWAILDDKLFFVDGTNVLRYFNGTAISTSSIYVRPTVAPTTSGGGTGFDYVYTVDNGLGESPSSPALVNKGSGITIRVATNTGPQTLVAGDLIRLYSRATTVAAASKNVTNASYTSYTVTGADVTATFADILTVPISDAAPQLYTELGLAVNKTAPTALTGLVSHYGRLVAWKGSFVYNSKVTNPHSWPDDTAQKEAFVYGFFDGDGENIQRCASFLESLFVFKKSKIAVFAGVGPDDTGNNAYAFRRLESNGIGCVAPKSVQSIGEEGEVYLIFLSKQGFMATGGNFPKRIGENIETAVFPFSESNLQNACSFYHRKLGVYFCFFGSAATRQCYTYDVRKDEGKTVGWFKFTGINAKNVYWDNDRYLFGTFDGFCGSERVAGSSVDFSDIDLHYFAAADVNTSTEVITVTHTFVTGDQVVIRTSGTIPAGLTANTIYYVIRVSGTTLKLATSSANALAGTAINITSQGSGTHSIVGKKAISAYYTTNYFKFKSALDVKKLAKLGLIFNAGATSIDIDVSVAVDWQDEFIFADNITVTSMHLWGDGLWGSFIWGSGIFATPKNIAIPKRKVRSVRYKFENSNVDQGFGIQGLEQDVAIIRNRGAFT